MAHLIHNEFAADRGHVSPATSSKPQRDGTTTSVPLGKRKAKSRAQRQQRKLTRQRQRAGG